MNELPGLLKKKKKESLLLEVIYDGLRLMYKLQTFK